MHTISKAKVGALFFVKLPVTQPPSYMYIFQKTAANWDLSNWNKHSLRLIRVYSIAVWKLLLIVTEKKLFVCEFWCEKKNDKMLIVLQKKSRPAELMKTWWWIPAMNHTHRKLITFGVHFLCMCVRLTASIVWIICCSSFSYFISSSKQWPSPCIAIFVKQLE